MRRSPHQIVDLVMRKMAEKGELDPQTSSANINEVTGEEVRKATPASVLTEVDAAISPVPEALQEAQKTASSFYILKKLAAYSDAMNATNDAPGDLIVDEPTAFAGLAGLGALSGAVGGGVGGLMRGAGGGWQGRLGGALQGIAAGSIGGMGLGAAAYGGLSLRDALRAGKAANRGEQ